jgi:phosphatidylcholine synthase
MVVLSLLVIAAAYGFCQRAAKTTEGFFTGFPNFWNIVVFYLFVFRLAPVLNAVVLLVFGFLVFVPLEYVSFSAKPFRKLTFTMAASYGLVLLVMVRSFPQVQPGLAAFSLLFPLYYVGLSFYLFVLRRIEERSLIQEI